jgi:hypothetical protein
MGFPASPVKAAKGYTIAIGAIVRDGVKITCMDFWKKGKMDLREYLLMKLFDRYFFRIEDDGRSSTFRRIREKALGIISKALNTWRTTANKIKDEDFETVIKKKLPQILEEDWKKFVKCHSEDTFRVLRSWGKCMQIKITMNHKLGSHGYRGKRILWATEDKVTLEARIAGPLSSLKPGPANYFVRAHAQIHPVKEETIFKTRTLEEVHNKLVCS